VQRILIERDFALPVDRVFAYLAEHEHLGGLFGTRVQRIRDGDDGHRNGAGSARRLSFGGLLPFEETVTEFVPGELIRYRITKGSPLRDHRGEMQFSPRAADGGSRLRYEIVFGARVPGLDRVVAASLNRSIRRGLDEVGGRA